MDEGSETHRRDVIRGHFVLDVSDVRRGLAEGGRSAQLRLIAVIISMLLFWQIVPRITGASEPPPWWVPLLTGAVAIPALLYGFWRAAARVMENRTEQERHITWEFDDEGYRIETPNSNTRAAWATVHRTGEGKTTFFVYPTATMYQIIPKRAFREEDIPRIRELFRTRVTPRKLRSRARLLVLWAVFVLAFLAVWQFLETARTPAGGDGQTETR